MRARLNLVLLALVAVCGASLWWAGRDDGPARDEMAAAQGAPPPAPLAVTAVAAGDDPPVRLAVLNGSGVSGLAGDVAGYCNRLDCVTTEIGNAPHAGYATSLLVNRRLADDRAHRLADKLGGLPVIREFDDRSQEDAVLVLGADAEKIRRAAAAAGGLEAVGADTAK